MPISNEKRKQREKMIIQAAMSLFLHSDYHLITMDMIATEAKMTKPTLYKYFSSKQDLYYVCSVLAYKTRWEQTKPKTYATGYEAVEEYTNNLVKFGFEKPDHLLFSSNVNMLSFKSLIFHSDISPHLIKQYDPIFIAAQRGFINIYLEGVKDGSIKPPVLKSFPMYFLYSIRGYLIERISSLIKLKSENENYKTDRYDLNVLLRLAKEEIDFHITKLLEQIKA